MTKLRVDETEETRKSKPPVVGGLELKRRVGLLSGVAIIVTTKIRKTAFGINGKLLAYL